jgi:hypothetical protein
MVKFEQDGMVVPIESEVSLATGLMHRLSAS